LYALFLTDSGDGQISLSSRSTYEQLSTQIFLKFEEIPDGGIVAVTPRTTTNVEEDECSNGDKGEM